MLSMSCAPLLAQRHRTRDVARRCGRRKLELVDYRCALCVARVFVLLVGQQQHARASAFGGRQRALEVREQIVRVLEPDGQSDGSCGDAGQPLHFGVELAASHHLRGHGE